MKTVIIGGVAGGMSAATRLRRLDETAEIIVFERGTHVSYANCGLPYYVGGVIEDRSSLLLQTPKSLASRFRLDVRVNHEVFAIDPDARQVSVLDVTTGSTFDESYDNLILAVGATARALAHNGSIPVHTLHTVDDVDAIMRSTHSAGLGSVLVLGAGFIGLEAVENLAHRGFDVILASKGDQVLSPFDAEIAAPIEEHLRSHGVDVRLGTVLDRIDGGTARLSDGSVLEPVFIIAATGVQPSTDLARSAGLRIGATGGIWVDDSQRTSNPHIFAVGDGVEKTDAVSGTPTLVTMAGLANRHGRTTADAIAGVGNPSVPALGTAIVGVFGLVAAKTGWTEKQLHAGARPHRVIHTHPASHATYYPGAQPMAIKLVVDSETDAILGAQIVGGEGVDKRIDVIATAMAAGLSASALSRLELAYAPQFGSAKDVINHLGYVAENVATGTTRTVQWHELPDTIENGAALVDVRTPTEFEAGHIPGAVNVPLDELRERRNELPDGALVVHCQVGQRGHTAARILAQWGRDVVNLDGGYKTWRAGQSVRSASAHKPGRVAS